MYQQKITNENLSSFISSFLRVGFACNVPSEYNNSKDITENLPYKEPQSDLDGILEFRINKTTLKDLDTMNYKREKVSEVYPNYDAMGIGVNFIQLKDFKKLDIEFSSVALTFQYDTLISLKCSSHKLYDALTTKYPNYTVNPYNSQEISWHNKSIEASLSGRFLFFIGDNGKEEKIYKKVKEIENDSLKIRYKDL